MEKKGLSLEAKHKMANITANSTILTAIIYPLCLSISMLKFTCMASITRHGHVRFTVTEVTAST